MGRGANVGTCSISTYESGLWFGFGGGAAATAALLPVWTVKEEFAPPAGLLGACWFIDVLVCREVLCFFIISSTCFSSLECLSTVRLASCSACIRLRS